MSDETQEDQGATVPEAEQIEVTASEPAAEVGEASGTETVIEPVETPSEVAPG